MLCTILYMAWIKWQSNVANPGFHRAFNEGGEAILCITLYTMNRSQSSTVPRLHPLPSDTQLNKKIILHSVLRHAHLDVLKQS